MTNASERPALQPGVARGAFARLLEHPHLARLVPQLRPEMLHQLIRHHGLDACAGLLTFATAAQMTAVLDLDLWAAPAPGQREQFDDHRFAEWLDTLADADLQAAVHLLADVDTDVVVTGLSRCIRVLDPAVFMPTAHSDDERPDGAGAPDGLWRDLGGYLIEARRGETWDAIVQVLAALEAADANHFHRLMRRCRALSHGAREHDGLDDLPDQPTQNANESEAARLARRSAQGHVAPDDARAFLALARQAGAAGGGQIANPIAAAYQRAPRGEPVAAAAAAVAGSPIDDPLRAVVEELEAAGRLVLSPRLLLAGADQPVALATLSRLMGWLRQHAEPTYLSRGEELAFLANVLMAGCSLQGRAFTAQEASDAVAATCNLALAETASLPDHYLRDHELVPLFEAGWAILARDVSMMAARELASALGRLSSGDGDTIADLRGLRRRLIALCERGEPCQARDLLDPLAPLDPLVWTALLGLFSECPVLPAAGRAVVERHKGRVDPIAFEFISTPAQLAVIRGFVERLPELWRA